MSKTKQKKHYIKDIKYLRFPLAYGDVNGKFGAIERLNL